MTVERISVRACDNAGSSSQQLITQKYEEFRPLLIRWLAKILGDTDAAFDIAQNAFIRVWAVAKNDQVQRPKSLLFKTAGRLALNELRRRKRFSRQFSYLGDFELEDEDGDTEYDRRGAARSMVGHEDAILAKWAIERMPPNSRKAFILHRITGLSYVEIAQELCVSRSSVEKYMIQAIACMRKEFEISKAE